MIYTIPQISINGQGGELGNPFFGGYIYNLNYDISIGSEGSSSLSVNLVSEDGQYSFTPSDLQVHQAYNIEIGNLSFNMYPKRMRKKYSEKGNLLEIEFTDGSFILDKYFVGLYKKHGGPSALGGDPSCFIIVGREFHPCDINNDGVVNIRDTVVDPCGLCGGLQQSQIQSANAVDCRLTSSLEIFNVKYNFGDLISAISGKGISLSGAFDPNPSYFKEHVGSLRSVLSAWCHDFGWIFFWENGGIKFKDLRTVPIVNAQINTFCPNIEEFEEEYTLDGTFNTVVLSNYSRAGIDKQNVCQDAKYLTMTPFTKESSPGGPLEVVDINPEAAGLCYYAKELRDLYYYFIDAELGDTNKFYPGNKIPKLSMTILSNVIKCDGSGTAGVGSGVSDISQIGVAPSDAFRNSVFDAPPHDDVSFLDTATLSNGSTLYNQRELIKANPEFLECFRLLDNESQWRVATHLGDYFFFVAHYDQERDNEKAQEERDYAGDFVGKFWTYIPSDGESFFQDYTFFSDNTCGEGILRNDNRIQYKFLGDTGDGSLTYFNNPGLTADGGLDRLSQLPFAPFLKILSHTGQDDINDDLRLQKLVCLSQGGERYFPSPTNVESDDDSAPNVPGNWLIQDKQLINEAMTFFPKILSTSMNQAGENVIRLLLANSPPDNAFDKNKIHIFLGYKNLNGAFSHTVNRGENPAVKKLFSFNGDPINYKLDPITGLPMSSIIYKYPTLLCTPLGNETSQCDLVTFHTPAGAFVYYAPTDSDYFSIIEKNEQKTRRAAKVETVLTDGSCGLGDNTLATIVDYHSIKDDDINKFLRIGPSCIYDINQIRATHNNFVRNLAIRQTTPLIKKIFTVDGIDINGPIPTIDQGLQNISISSNNAGVRTTYTLGTSHMLLPDPDVYSRSYGNVGIQGPSRANGINLPYGNSSGQ